MYVKNSPLRIVSRKSRLALQQAEIVKLALLELYPQLSIEIIGISTSGDEILDQALSKIGGKGLFVKELENYLLDNKADIAVHSMKDMPANLPAGLAIAAVLKRADVRDVFVSEKYTNFSELPAGSIVGTSSLRRQAQVLAQRDDLRVTSLRGNVETRLNKLQNGEYAAIILAAAGLERLGLQRWAGNSLATEIMLPAVGQGALGIECKLADLALQKLLAPLNDLDTWACVLAERAMNARLDGGCQAPIAGLAHIKKQSLHLQGLVASPDGKQIYTASANGLISDAAAIGELVADKLIDQGADKIIRELRALWH